MSTTVTCDCCGKRLAVPDHLAGKRARCKCGGVVHIPAAPVPAELGLDDLAVFESHASSAAAGVGIGAGACPSCGETLAAGAVLCVACGFDLRRGTRAVTTMEAPASEPDAAKGGRPETLGKGKPAKVPALNGGGSALGKTLKICFVLALLGGLGFAAYHIKESITFNPQKQRDDDHARVYPGMTVKDVVDALGRPPKEVLTERGPTKDKLVAHLPKKLAYSDNFMEMHKPEDLRYGFWFVYRYSERAELIIYFESNGKVHSAVKHDPLQMIGL